MGSEQSIVHVRFGDCFFLSWKMTLPSFGTKKKDFCIASGDAATPPLLEIHRNSTNIIYIQMQFRLSLGNRDGPDPLNRKETISEAALL